MKKYFLIVLSIFLTALMPACAQTQRDPYKIYVAGYSDSISKANHSLEIDLSNETTYKGSVKKTKTVNVFGNEYEVTYKETKKRYLYNCEWDCYEYSDDKMGVFVNINSRTGNIDYCSIAMKEGYEKVYIDKLSQEECLTISQNYLSNHVDDVENYRVDNVREYYNGFRFSFSRYIGELATCDGASITVNFNGEIETFQSECLNELKNAELPPDDIIDQIKNNIDKKLGEIYDAVDDKDKLSYGEKELIFTRFEDGSYGFEIFIDVSLSSDSNNGNTYIISERNRFVVFID